MRAGVGRAGMKNSSKNGPRNVRTLTRRLLSDSGLMVNRDDRRFKKVLFRSFNPWPQARQRSYPAVRLRVKRPAETSPIEIKPKPEKSLLEFKGRPILPAGFQIPQGNDAGRPAGGQSFAVR